MNRLQELESLRKRYVAVFAIFVAVALGVYVVIYGLAGSVENALFRLIFLLLTLSGLVHYKIHNTTRILEWTLKLTLVVMFINFVHYSGVGNTGLYWTFLVPIVWVFITAGDPRKGLMFLAGIFAFHVFLSIASYLPLPWNTTQYIIGFMVYSFASITSYYYYLLNYKQRFELFEQNKKLSAEIAKRKQVEAVLEHDKEQLQFIFDHASDGIWMLDNEKMTTGVNPAMAAMLGYLPEKMIGRSLFDFLVKEEVHLEHPRFSRAEMINQNQHIEMTLQHASSHHVYVHFSSSVLKDEEGRVVGSFAFVTDMTAKRQYEQNLQVLNQELEKRVSKEVEQRRNQETILFQQSRLASMGEMIGAIAHQWRQPLNTLAILIQDLKDAYEHDEMDDLYLDEITQKSMKKINYMSDTIDDFRTFFKEDKRAVEFTVRTLFSDVESLLISQLKYHNIIISALIDEDRVILGYPNQLKQVLINLIMNAKDAILEIDNPYFTGSIELSYHYHDGEHIIEVIDNGGGIDEEIMERIFDPYFSTKGDAQGTGIGLYMSKMIIERNLLGHMSASNDEMGARFKIRFSDQEGM